MESYDITLKNGKIVKIAKERYEILRKILAHEESQAFLELNQDTIISTAMIACIEKSDDGSLE